MSQGRRRWAFAGGRIPLGSAGPEPEFTGRDQIAMLNTGGSDVATRWTIYFEEADPFGPYEVTVSARRVRKVRVNDLIFPEAVPLDTPYGLVIEAGAPIVVQVLRLDRRAEVKARESGNGPGGRLLLP